MKLIALLVRGHFHWGFSIRYPGTSAAAESYIVPPPTTLVGALARGLAEVGILPRTEVYYNGNNIVSTSEILTPCIKVSTFRYDNNSISLPLPYMDPVKLIRAPYQRESEDKSPIGFCGFGKVYSPSVSFEILYIIDIELLRSLARLVTLDINHVVLGAYSITMLGSKESLVSIDSVEVTDSVEVIYKPPIKEIELSFYCPAGIVEIEEFYRSYITIQPLPIPSKNWYTIYGKRTHTIPIKTKVFLIPVRRGSFLEPVRVEAKVRCTEKTVLYECRFLDKTIHIPWTGEET